MSEPLDDTEGAGRGTHDPVGSVSDEAVKLFGALSDWARDQGTDRTAGWSGLVDHAAQSLREVNDHIATGSEDCTYCPICRTVHAVRRTSPEVKAHLGAAASSLLQAAAGVLATAVPPERHTGERGSGVEHIDLDTEISTDGVWPEEDDE